MASPLGMGAGRGIGGMGGMGGVALEASVAERAALAVRNERTRPLALTLTLMLDLALTLLHALPFILILDSGHCRESSRRSSTTSPTPST